MRGTGTGAGVRVKWHQESSTTLPTTAGKPYRPVSLTSVVCKLLENIIVSAVMRHSEENSILTDNQHGFRRGRSCEIQLLELVEELTTNLESGKQTDVLIMDFNKAFDKVNHSLLLHKVQRYGV